MSYKSIKKIIGTIFCSAVIVANSAVIMATNASSADRNWISEAGVQATYEGGKTYYEIKDNTSSVYVSNRGYHVQNGRYVYKGQPKKINFSISGHIGYRNTPNGSMEYISYDCENYYGSYYFCGGGAWQPRLSIAGGETRVIFQFIRENYQSALNKNSSKLRGKYSINCYACLELDKLNKSYGVWSPDTSNSYLYNQVDGQGIRRGQP